MPILYLLNYIELSYSEITFTYWTFDSKISALSNFFQIDRIDELHPLLFYYSYLVKFTVIYYEYYFNYFDKSIN